MLCATALLSSCHIYKAYDRPEVNTSGIYRDPASATDTLAADTANMGNLPWKEVFRDPKLQSLIELGLGLRGRDSATEHPSRFRLPAPDAPPSDDGRPACRSWATWQSRRACAPGGTRSGHIRPGARFRAPAPRSVPLRTRRSPPACTKIRCTLRLLSPAEA